jgi:hypothetical protein
MEIHGMQTSKNRSRVAVSSHVEHQNVDRILRALDLLSKPAATYVHALLRVRSVEEVSQIVSCDSLKSSLELTLVECRDELLVNGMYQVAVENIAGDFVVIPQPCRAHLNRE